VEVMTRKLKKEKLVDLLEKGNTCAAKYIENEDM
jgi:hypothetical protein